MNQLSAKERKAYEEWLLTCKRIHDSTEPVKDESAEQKQKRIAHLLKPQNFEEFIQYYFSTNDTKLAPLGWFHRKAIDNLFIKKLRKHIWEWHRESAKSVFADIFVPIYMLCKGELTGMILAGENEDKAKNLIKDVEAQLRNNRRLMADFGDFGISGSWLSSFFQTRDGIGFWAFGLGQNPAGVRNGFKRPNLGIVDDADNKDKAKNQKLTKERLDWIKGEFMGCLAKDNRYFIYVNNRVHKYGLTAHLVGDVEDDDPKDESYAHIKVYLTEDPKTHKKLMPEEGGQPAWKEYYSLQDCIDKIEDYGYRNALRQLYHTHVTEGNVFTDDNMPWVEILPLDQYDSLVTYCDPAFGESGKGCYRFVGLVGMKGLNYDVIWCWLQQKGSFAQAQFKLKTMIEANDPIFYSQKYPKAGVPSCTHWVESNELQKILLKKIYKEENEVRGFPWYPKFDMEKKEDKITRIESLETIADNMHLRFNVAMKKNKDMQTLRDQFKSFPDGFIDGPDGVEGAISKLEAKVKSKSFKMRSGKFKRSGVRRA